MRLINLSSIPKFGELSTEEAIDYCLDNDIDTIRDNFSDYKIEYTLSDLIVIPEYKTKTIWENIRDRGIEYLERQELKIKINYYPKEFE
jgi:hypothetical protein